MIRPQARAALHRWGGLLLAGAVALAAMALWRGTFGWVRFAALPLGVLAGALALDGWRRARFLREGGTGLVRVTEGQITYLSAFASGTLALDALTRIERDTSAPAPRLTLYAPPEPPLTIPTDAEGAAALYDLLLALPGLDAGRLTGEAEGEIWTRAIRSLH